jgi:inosine-uridine nucleoside N-ribohydrolase/formylmethanofuran dehydrogenase subunit E
MKIKYFCIPIIYSIMFLKVQVPALAHNIPDQLPVIIDTDFGLDDSVALALALQNPEIDIVGMIPSEGVCEFEKCAEFLNRIRTMFNRNDIPIYKPTNDPKRKPIPKFRQFAQEAIDDALPDSLDSTNILDFSAQAYVLNSRKTAILALGPMTNLARALNTEPKIKDEISHIILPGKANPEQSWNLLYDRASYEVVRKSGIELLFIISNDNTATKPSSWTNHKFELGTGTAVGERFFRRVMQQDGVGEHYVQELPFYDELALLAIVEPLMFELNHFETAFRPTRNSNIAKSFTKWLTSGRQKKDRVVFEDGEIPETMLRPDIRKYLKSIIDKNGETEFFAQLIMNELHEHLGAYSIIGVKMGLYAMEQLNAPQHSMKVVSHVSTNPPVSCLNDGIMVATGCTIGRALFRQENVDDRIIKVTFSYNAKTITLSLKESYRNQVRTRIQEILRKNSVKEEEYWLSVRELGIEIWEKWHRTKLFDIDENN